MGNDSTMIAIESALRSTRPCECGDVLDIHARDGALWLECRTFVSATRLPVGLALALRRLVHSSSFVATDPCGIEAKLPRDTRATLHYGARAQA